MSQIFVFLFLFSSIFSFATVASENQCVDSNVEKDDSQLVIATESGSLLGKRNTRVDPRTGKTISTRSFLDIPYAAPPVDNLRFLPPLPAETWGPNCLLDARRTAGGEGRVCPQLNLKFSLSGLVNNGLSDLSDEDCLLLDVYVPEGVEDGDELLPVLFWIHGGGYTGGSGSIYDPIYYLAHGIVVVTIRYRLGALGFLSLGTEDVPGNAGVRDQALAMQWVQTNIRQFGGDPDLVTVNGQSAGSFSTVYHLFSPLSNGMFKRIIGQSGPGGFSPSYSHFSEERATKYGKQAAIAVGCLDLDLDVTAECMRGKSVFSLLSTGYVPNELSSFPSLDPGSQENSFLPLEPALAMQTGHYKDDVDIIIGHTSDECLLGTQWFLAAPHLFDVVRELWDFVGPYALLQRHTSEISQADIELATEILRYYVGEVEDLGPDDFDNFNTMASDSFFLFGEHRFLDLHLGNQNRTGRTYQYQFNFKGHCQDIDAPGLDSLPGVNHAEDNKLLWVISDKPCTLTEDEAEMSFKFTTMWANFVKTGNPTPDDQVDMFPVQWTPVSKSQREYFIIDREQRMELDQGYLDRMAFWDSVYLKL